MKVALALKGLIWNAKNFTVGGYLCYFKFGLQAEIQRRYKTKYLFGGCYFDTIMGNVEIQVNLDMTDHCMTDFCI